MTILDYYRRKQRILDQFENESIGRTSAALQLNTLQTEALEAGLQVSGQMDVEALLDEVESIIEDNDAYENSCWQDESDYDDDYEHQCW